ncbi:MAG: V-type ATPase subunit [Candidatus Rehaiarchaeum fermentans]|nr:V-type ATPase subunit [Candidatus Rehaiarchaeum fermentans]MCW1297315.1 V-type ATPase subunit [Candidatus Rehaiarchaeum fermentans]MCW1302360.1 V-type ATPase subunit [Candidatus Rehaiarchaeum fermentans]
MSLVGASRAKISNLMSKEKLLSLKEKSISQIKDEINYVSDNIEEFEANSLNYFFKEAQDLYLLADPLDRKVLSSYLLKFDLENIKAIISAKLLKEEIKISDRKIEVINRFVGMTTINKLDYISLINSNINEIVNFLAERFSPSLYTQDYPKLFNLLEDFYIKNLDNTITKAGFSISKYLSKENVIYLSYYNDVRVALYYLILLENQINLIRGIIYLKLKNKVELIDKLYESYLFRG